MIMNVINHNVIVFTPNIPTIFYFFTKKVKKLSILLHIQFSFQHKKWTKTSLVLVHSLAFHYNFLYFKCWIILYDFLIPGK